MSTMNGRRFSAIHVTVFLISCLTLMGCYSPDWSDKDADFLITQLKNNRDYNLRAKAVYLLASKAQERDKVIPALTHALLDEYSYVRETAADVLGSIEPPAVSAIPALIETLRDENTGRRSSFSSEAPMVHEMAIKSLGEMGPDAAEAIPVLTEVFCIDRLRDAAGVAILKIDPSMHTVKEELIERRAVWPLAQLAEEGDESLVPVLIKLLNDPDLPGPYTNYSAAEALKNIGTPEALDAAVAYYIQRLDSQRAWIRADAAEELKDIGTPEALDAAIPALFQLLNAPDAWARFEAAKALKDIGTPEALEAVKGFEKRRWWPF